MRHLVSTLLATTTLGMHSADLFFPRFVRAEMVRQRWIWASSRFRLRRAAVGSGLAGLSAFGFALFASAEATLAQAVCPSPVVVNNTSCALPAGSTVNVAPVGAIGLSASGAQGSIAARDSTVNLNAGGTTGASAQQGATIVFNGSTVTTGPAVTSSGQVGLQATGAGSSIIASGSTIDLTPTSGAPISMTGATVQAGGQISLSNTNVTVGLQDAGDTNLGLQASGAGSRITVTGGSVTTASRGSYGVHVQNGGAVSLTSRTQVTTTGGETAGTLRGSDGLVATGAGSRIDAAFIDVRTSGALASGANAENGGTVAFSGGTITTTGNGTAANPTAGARVFNGGTLLINETGSASTTITTSGAFGHGILAEDANSTATVRNAVIATSGANANGVMATDGGPVTLSNSTITTTGTGSNGVAVEKGGRISASNIAVQANGSGASALSMRGGSAGDQRGSFTGSMLTSEDAPAISVAGGNANVALTGTTVTGNGVWLDVFDATAPAVLDLTADSSVLNGSAHTASTSNVTLQNGATWNLTGSSNLTNLTNDASLIDFSTPLGDPTLLSSYKTLTVANYIGVGGQIELNTYLDTDGSPSDRLVIDGGAASGSTILLITNSGGPGALTTGDGILVVDATNGGTTQTTAFSLGGAVVGGPYEYLLFRGGAVAGTADDWFLRNQIDCSLPGAPIPPCGGGIPNPGPVPIFRQEVSLYAAIPPMAAIYGRQLIDSLQERVGDETLLKGSTELSGQGTFNGVWGRIIGHHGERDAGGFLGGSPAFDYSFGAMQVGMDLYRHEQSNGLRDHAGIYLAYGHGQVDVMHNLLGREFDAGTNNFDAYTVGGYWTRFGGDPDWYVDGVVQGTWYDVTTQSRRSTRLGFPDQDVSGFGFATSLEGGYPFYLGDGWKLEPQAQLIYQTIDFGSFQDSVAEVRFDDYQSLAGRIGGRLAKTWDINENHGAPEPKQMTAWGQINIWHEFLGKTSTQISSASGFVPFSSKLDETWVELGVGASLQMTASTTLFGNVNYETTFDGDSHGFDGKIGLRVNW